MWEFAYLLTRSLREVMRVQEALAFQFISKVLSKTMPLWTWWLYNCGTGLGCLAAVKGNSNAATYKGILQNSAFSFLTSV